MKLKRRCRYCRIIFTPSIYHLAAQQVCSSVDCQRTRRREDHRKRYRTEALYRQVCRESTEKWRQDNPGYQSSYRQTHPAYVLRNREAQRGRDRKRRMTNLVKNNLAIDVKPRPTRVWLVGPDFEPLVKNNLAISEVVIFHDVTAAQVPSQGIL